MIGEFIKTISGTKLFMIDGYTFGKRFKNLYYCSKRRFKCMCSVKLDDDGVSVLRFTGEHNHPPPQYKKTDEGYVKISR